MPVCLVNLQIRRASLCCRREPPNCALSVLTFAAPLETHPPNADAEKQTDAYGQADAVQGGCRSGSLTIGVVQLVEQIAIVIEPVHWADEALAGRAWVGRLVRMGGVRGEIIGREDVLSHRGVVRRVG